MFFQNLKKLQIAKQKKSAKRSRELSLLHRPSRAVLHSAQTDTTNKITGGMVAPSGLVVRLQTVNSSHKLTIDKTYTM